MKTKPHDASGKALADLIEHAQKTTGTIKTLAENLTARTGTTVYRQYVGLWLHPESPKRVEPPLGMGLLLIEEGRKLMGTASPAPAAPTRKTKPRKMSRKKARKTKTVRKARRKSRK